MVFEKKKGKSVLLKRRLPVKKLFRSRKKHGTPLSVPMSKKKKIFFFGYWIFLIFFLTLSFYTLFFSRYTRIDEVRIEGTYAISNDSLLKTLSMYLSEKYMFIFPKNNYFFFSEKELSRILQSQFRSIYVAHIKKKFPRLATMSLEEYKAVLVWCSGGPCFFVSTDGKIYDGVHLESGNEYPELVRVIDKNVSPVVFGENIMSSDDVVFLNSLKEAIFETAGVEVVPEYQKSFRFSREISADTREGWMLLINMDSDVSTIALSLRSFLDEDSISEIRSRLEYVDMRSENKIFYALKGEEIEKEKLGGEKPETEVTGTSEVEKSKRKKSK